MIIEKTETEKKFEPIKIEITIENESELVLLGALFNNSSTEDLTNLSQQSRLGNHRILGFLFSPTEWLRSTKGLYKKFEV